MGTYVKIQPVNDMPCINFGDDIAREIVLAASKGGIIIKEGDIIVVAQKIVSKAEGRVVDLTTVTPSEQAQELSRQTGRDARLCQVYIDESSEIIRVKGRMVITRHKLGFECSGAGVDRSNVAPHDQLTVVLLPKDPDKSARDIRNAIRLLAGVSVAVVINDSFGRHDREGSVGMAIGIAGIHHLELREQKDLFGNPSNSMIALVDELAAAASLVMGQANEGVPAVVISGVPFNPDEEATISKLLVEKG